MAHLKLILNIKYTSIKEKINMSRVNQLLWACFSFHVPCFHEWHCRPPSCPNLVLTTCYSLIISVGPESSPSPLLKNLSNPSTFSPKSDQHGPPTCTFSLLAHSLSSKVYLKNQIWLSYVFGAIQWLPITFRLKFKLHSSLQHLQGFVTGHISTFNYHKSQLKIC